MYLSNFDEMKYYLKTLELKQGEELMILVGDKSAQHVEELIAYLNNENIKFFGGIFPGLLVGNKHYSQGFIVQKYEPIYSSIVLPYLMFFKLDMEQLRNCTAILLVDGLSSRMKDLTDTAYDKLKDHVKYIGGGAGYQNLKHKPCIFTNKGIFKDVMYICIVKSDIQTAVTHGWQRLKGPFYVTKSQDNTLIELDSENAFEVYKHIIEEEEKVALFREDFFIFAKDHPFGIAQKDDTDVVRDPIALGDNNEIICVANIPQDSDIYVLKGDTKTLLDSSLKIAEQCSSKVQGEYAPLLFDCISRAMFLEENFEKELENIQNKLAFPVEGALSIGEIASNTDGQIEIHNKSTVLGLLHKNKFL